MATNERQSLVHISSSTSEEKGNVSASREEAGGGVAAAVFEGEFVRVKEVGRRVNVPGNLYGKANFYIEQSRPYVGGYKLTRYMYIFYMNFAYVAVMFTTLFIPFHVAFSVIMLIVNAIFLLFYIQHMYVNIKTMPCVLKQPSFPDRMLDTNNKILEISLENFRATYVVANEAGFGLFDYGRDSVRIQIFRESAMFKMKLCVLMSTVLFFASLIAVIYCLAWVIVLILRVQDES